MLKILQARLQQYVNRELLDVQAGFRKGRGARDQIANIHWIIKKAREFQKTHLFSGLLIMPRPLTVWITINSPTPKFSVSVPIFHIRMFIEYHQTAFSFQISHET